MTQVLHLRVQRHIYRPSPRRGWFQTSPPLALERRRHLGGGFWQAANPLTPVRRAPYTTASLGSGARRLAQQDRTDDGRGRGRRPRRGHDHVPRLRPHRLPPQPDRRAASPGGQGPDRHLQPPRQPRRRDGRGPPDRGRPHEEDGLRVHRVPLPVQEEQPGDHGGGRRDRVGARSPGHLRRAHQGRRRRPGRLLHRDGGRHGDRRGQGAPRHRRPRPHPRVPICRPTTPSYAPTGPTPSATCSSG